MLVVGISIRADSYLSGFGAGPTTGALLQENGFFLLKEDGGFILLE